MRGAPTSGADDGGVFDVVRHGEQLALMRLRGEGVVLSLKPEHYCFEICDAPAESLIFVDQAYVVAAHISKESLGHECFLQETLLVAQFSRIVDPGRLGAQSVGS